MPFWRRRAGFEDGRADTGDAPPTPEDARDERLSAYLDGELAAGEAAAVERELAASRDAASALAELRLVREALAELGELRAPRPFTLAAPAAVRGGLPRLELLGRLGATVAAVALAVVLTGDLAGLAGDEDVASPSSEVTSLSAADSAATESAAAAPGDLRSTRAQPADGDDSIGAADAAEFEAADDDRADAAQALGLDAANDADEPAEAAEATASTQADPPPAEGALAADSTAEPPTGPAADPGEAAAVAAPASGTEAPAAADDAPPAPSEDAADGAGAAATEPLEAAVEGAAEAATPAPASPSPTPRVAVPSTPEATAAAASEVGADADETGGVAGTAKAQPTSDTTKDDATARTRGVIRAGLLIAVLGFGGLALGQWVARRRRSV